VLLTLTCRLSIASEEIGWHRLELFVGALLEESHIVGFHKEWKELASQLYYDLKWERVKKNHATRRGNDRAA